MTLDQLNAPLRGVLLEPLVIEQDGSCPTERSRTVIPAGTRMVMGLDSEYPSLITEAEYKQAAQVAERYAQ